MSEVPETPDPLDSNGVSERGNGQFPMPRNEAAAVETAVSQILDRAVAAQDDETRLELSDDAFQTLCSAWTQYLERVLQRAQELRIDDGADLVNRKHVTAAVKALRPKSQDRRASLSLIGGTLASGGALNNTIGVLVGGTLSPSVFAITLGLAIVGTVLLVYGIMQS